MSRIRAGLVVVAVAAAAALGEETRRAGPAPSAAAVAPSAAEIDRAVARAVAWLRSEQDADGGFGSTAGETGLVLWALRHAGVARDDRAAVRAAARLERDLPDGTTYGNALGLCGLLAHDRTKHAERIQKVADALVRGQAENGQWTYLCRRARAGAGDNSNTQCALLALGGAAARGFRVPPATFESSLAFVRATQNEDGGWGYSKAQARASYGTMTAGMLMSFVLANSGRARQDPTTTAFGDEPAARRARDWLAANFRVAADRGGAATASGSVNVADQWQHYWLWSLERAGTVAGFSKVGERDWWAEGARWLIDRQADDGRWVDKRPVPDTAWSVLFLRRGTVAVVTPRDDPAAAATPAGEGR